MNGLPKPCYVMSEPHLSGYRVVLGYETLTEAQDAQSALAASPPAREEAPAEGAGEEVEDIELSQDDPETRLIYKHFCDVHCLNPDEAADATGALIEDLSALRNRTSEPEAGAVAWTDQENIDQLKTGRGAAIMWPTCHGPSTPFALFTHPAPATADKLRIDPVLFDHAWKLVEAIRGGGTPPFLTPEEAANQAAPYLLGRLAERNAEALAALERGEG